jgi:hypothetical protein
MIVPASFYSVTSNKTIEMLGGRRERIGEPFRGRGADGDCRSLGRAINRTDAKQRARSKLTPPGTLQEIHHRGRHGLA